MIGACVSGSIFLFLVVAVSTERVTRQTYKGVTCLLPDHPENGQWRLLKGSGDPGDTVEFSTIIQFSCYEGYKLRSRSAYVVCTKDFNPNLMPRCTKMCPAVYSTSTTSVECRDENRGKADCSEATDGTYMTYTCLPYYEPPIGQRKSILCLDGNWNAAKPVCEPVCGKKNIYDKVALIYGGTVAKSIEYPWLVAIFRKTDGQFVNICGGSLISRRVILTAAHCLTDESGGPMAKENFRVGLGKYYLQYKEPRDDQAQYLEPMRIVTRNGYKGQLRNYIEDIGMIITRKLVKLSSVVQPVCIRDINSMQINVGNIGEIAGWGAKEDGLASEVLRKLEIPYKDQTQCADELNQQEAFADRYNLLDKICAGFYNKNISVCNGDSGHGLVFRSPDDNRYYIHGIVSISPSNQGKCSINQNTLYTRVSYYYEFIDREVSRNYAEDCRLPPYPENGRWIIESDRQTNPGDVVSSTATLRVSCREGYSLDGDAFISCDSASNMPTCDIECEPLVLSPVSKLSCLDRRRRKIECQNATEDSTAIYYCLGDSGSYGPQQFRQCLKGSWGSPLPSCPDITPSINATKSTVAPATSASSGGPKIFCTYDASFFPKQGVPEDLDPFLCTHLVCNVAANFGGDAKLLFEGLYVFYDTGTTKGLFSRMTDLKKINVKLKVLLSITGWKNDNNFDPYSITSASDSSADDFIERALPVLRKYNFDGLIIDWHNPGKHEKENFARLMAIAKKKLKANNYLFPIPIGQTVQGTGYDPEAVSKYADWVIVKTYDFIGNWSWHTMQNSALYPSPTETDIEKVYLNVNSSITNWLNLGIPKDRLIMSIPFQTNTFTLKNSSKHDLRARITGYGPGREGHLLLREICLQYQNYTVVWDDYQKNPYKYNGKFWFGYENEESLRIKGQYIRDQRLAGVNVYPVNGDDIYGKCGERQHYLKQVRVAVGAK